MADAKEDRLRGLRLFNKAERNAIEHLSSAADEVSVSAGQTLIEQGRHHHELYVIESGTATVLVDGTEVAEIPAGEMLGELGFFVSEAASATVKAKTDMELLVIPYNRFNQILDDNPRLVREIAVELAYRLYAMDEKLN
ncbi:MAG: cyclic nucleotide-binding domain-containing protein [Acidimicrobiales bacterium]